MSEKNPFTVLGFAPNVFKDMGDEDIRSLVKSQYRALAMIHHTDRGGKEERFKEVQGAFDKLKEDFEFDFWKKMFFRNRKDQLAELQKEAREGVSEATQLQQSIADFWIAFCQGRQIIPYATNSLMGESANDWMDYKSFSAFCPPAIALLVADSFDVSAKTQAIADGREKNPTRSWFPIVTRECLELRISPEGVLTRQDLVKTQFNPENEAMPMVRSEFICLNAVRPALSYYWRPDGKPQVLPGKLLGSLGKQCLSDKQMEKDFPKIGGLVTQGMSDKNFKRVQHGFAFHEFEKFLRFIVPVVEKYELLVYVEGHSDLRFKILGQVIRIFDPKD